MNTQIAMLVNEKKEMYNINFSGSYVKLITVLLMAIVHIMNSFGINKKSDSKLVKEFCNSLSETLCDMVLEREDNEQKLQKDTDC